MSKKTTYTLKISSDQIPNVVKGKKIEPGDFLTKEIKEEIFEFNLAKDLEVPPDKVKKFLKVKINSQVNKGTVIAFKKKLFNSQIIKSPDIGEFICVDEKKGIYGIKKTLSNIKPLISWFSGQIVDFDNAEIVIAIEGEVVPATNGKGKPVLGKLKIIPEVIDIFSMPTDINQSILVIKKATSEIVAKADALGAVAIVAENLEEPPFALPYLVIEKITDLDTYANKTVIVYGDEKHLLISETIKPIPKK